MPILPILFIAMLGLAGCAAAEKPVEEHNSLGSCLTEKGVKFYGAFWCPHCAEQKKELGTEMKDVTYIECALPKGGQTQECNDAGIEGYPTWEFADGSRLTGKLSLQQLSEKTGCKLG